MSNTELARVVMKRIEELGRISDEPDRLTRAFWSPAMRRANDQVGAWMRDAGMTVTEDAIGNLIGRYPGGDERSKTFILGSHLDTVRDAGRFDGPLGVILAIACVQHLHDQKARLPFALEVVGFADEEGVRYQTTYLGSKVQAGTFNQKDLKRVDSNGVSMADAIRAFGGNPDKLKELRRDPQSLLGYAEVHIEQGPVLEKRMQPVGVVSAIAGQTRVKVRFAGQAGHAGTTPMVLRHDALASAAQFIVGVETSTRLYTDLLATVGKIEALPGVSNVIPGEVVLTVDVRHQLDSMRFAACERLRETATHAGESRGVAVEWEVVHDAASVPCSRELTNMLSKAARQHLVDVTELVSGAGHDAAILGDITPAAMLFIRCKGGISHHPEESASVDDVEVAIGVMNDFLRLVANQQPMPPTKKNA
jgi:allantoate deiminase